jgi:hypothetical protein
MAEYKQCSYSLHKAIKQAKRHYRDKVEKQFNGSDTRCMGQELWTVTDNKGKTSHVTDTSVLLPDKLNTFFTSFEDNTRPTTKDCGLSFSVADVSKTFKHVNPRKAAGPDVLPGRVLRALINWLVCLRTYSISPYPSLLSIPASRCPALFLYPRKRR